MLLVWYCVLELKLYFINQFGYILSYCLSSRRFSAKIFRPQPGRLPHFREEGAYVKRQRQPLWFLSLFVYIKNTWQHMTTMGFCCAYGRPWAGWGNQEHWSWSTLEVAVFWGSLCQVDRRLGDTFRARCYVTQSQDDIRCCYMLLLYGRGGVLKRFPNAAIIPQNTSGEYCTQHQTIEISNIYNMCL